MVHSLTTPPQTLEFAKMFKKQVRILQCRQGFLLVEEVTNYKFTFKGEADQNIAIFAFGICNIVEYSMPQFYLSSNNFF